MQICRVVIAFAISLSLAVPAIAQENAQKEGVSTEKDAAFKFAELDYFHRFTEKNQHEYTPKGDEDLDRWNQMVTINYYPEVKDGETLAATANNALEQYKSAKGKVLKTNSVPKSNEKPAEHLIVVAFVRPDFTEVAFARFRMNDGLGTAIVYSRRYYGSENAKDATSWLKKSGKTTEETLMQWDSMPEPPASK